MPSANSGAALAFLLERRTVSLHPSSGLGVAHQATHKNGDGAGQELEGVGFFEPREELTRIIVRGFGSVRT